MNIVTLPQRIENCSIVIIVNLLNIIIIIFYLIVVRIIIMMNSHRLEISIWNETFFAASVDGYGDRHWCSGIKSCCVIGRLLQWSSNSAETNVQNSSGSKNSGSVAASLRISHPNQSSFYVYLGIFGSFQVFTSCTLKKLKVLHKI